MIIKIIEQIRQTRETYIQTACRKPTHIFVSYKLHSDLLRYAGDNYGFFHDRFTNKETLLGMVVVPVADPILPEREYKFLLLSDETSKNFPQHPPLSWSKE